MRGTFRGASRGSPVLVVQGIEEWFPKPNCGVRLPPRKTSKFLAVTRKWRSLKANRDLANHPRFPTIRGNCCAEVVLESSMEMANSIARLSTRFFKPRHPSPVALFSASLGNYATRRDVNAERVISK